MMNPSLLVELFVEELPPKVLKKLGEVFAAEVLNGLSTRDFTALDSKVTSFATPRRLAVHITNVLATSPPKEIVEKLMPVSVAIGADGKPTPALRKRLEKVGRSALADLWPNATDGSDSLLVQPDGKADAVFLSSLAPGQSLLVGLQSALEMALSRLPIPKVMTYQLHEGHTDGLQPGWTSVHFVRPAHGLVALHGEVVVNVSVLGLEAGRVTKGHRFEATLPETLRVKAA